MFGNTNNMFGQPQANQGSHTLLNAVANMIPQVVQELCAQNGIDANTANQLNMHITGQSAQIADALSQQYKDKVHGSVVVDTIRTIATAALNDAGVTRPMFTQPQPAAMGGGMFGGGTMIGGAGMHPQANVSMFGVTPGNTFNGQGGMFGNGGMADQIGTTSISTPTNTSLANMLDEKVVNPPEPSVCETPQPAPSSAFINVSIDPIVTFDKVDVPNIKRFDKTTDVYPILSVSKMCKYQNSRDHSVVNFSMVHSAIREISVSKAISNIVKTNPRLYKDNWLGGMSFEVISVFPGFGTDHTKVIDTTVLNDPDVDISAYERIDSVLSSIEDRKHRWVEAFSDLFITRFNDLLKRYIRLADCSVILSVKNFAEIRTLLKVKSEGELGRLVNHSEFVATYLKCFKYAFGSIVGDTDKTGYTDIGGVIFDMKAHPDFVIREQGICERDPEIDTDEKGMAFVKDNFTVITQSHLFVCGNFIPNELLEDLNTTDIISDETRSIIDEIIWSQFPGDEPTFILKEDDEVSVMFGAGKTLDGQRFIFKIDKMIS